MNESQWIIETLKDIQAHIVILNDEQGIQNIKLAEIGTQLDFMYKFFWIFASASVGSFFATMWQILKKGK